MMRVLECTAQEVYRGLLFVVFTVEVYILSLVPFAGRWGCGANLVLLQTAHLAANSTRQPADGSSTSYMGCCRNHEAKQHLQQARESCSSSAVTFTTHCGNWCGCCMPAGVVLNVLFLSWLYAYYCFDYKWALEGIRLPNRLHFFECNWAYFAGVCSGV